MARTSEAGLVSYCHLTLGTQMALARDISLVKDCGARPHRSPRMFCNLAPAALEAFKDIGVNSYVAKGVILFREPNPAEEAFVPCTGMVKLICTSRAGKSVIPKIAHPGDVLGLSTTISGERHNATAKTVEPTLIKTLRRSELIPFFEGHRESSLHASQSLSLESNKAFLDIKRLAVSGSAAAKIASVLLDCGQRARCQGDEMRFAMTLTHEELGSLAGTSRETVTRTLRRFQDERLIQITGYFRPNFPPKFAWKLFSISQTMPGPSHDFERYGSLPRTGRHRLLTRMFRQLSPHALAATYKPPIERPPFLRVPAPPRLHSFASHITRNGLPGCNT